MVTITVDELGAVELVGRLELEDAVERVDRVDKVDSVETVESVETVDTVETDEERALEDSGGSVEVDVSVPPEIAKTS